MAYGLWEVSGKIIIPGTRKSASFGPLRIGDKDRQTASKHIARLLNEKFKRELRGDHKFSDHFALMNLRWDSLSKAKPQVEAIKAVDQAPIHNQPSA
jgi:hypothetical protein